MNDTLVTFKKYPSQSYAEEIAALLNDNNIETLLTDNMASFDATFSGNKLQNEYEIKIKKTDFAIAASILEKSAENELSQVNPDHYLFQFTNEELYDILIAPDEWNEFDYKLAQKLLKERGKTINSEILASLKVQRIKALSKPEENQKPWIIAGYFMAILGGFLGILIGYVLWTSKKTLPNGEQVYSYMENDRVNGKVIFYIGIIIFPIALLYKIFDKI